MKITVVQPEELGPAELDTWRTLLRESTDLISPFLCPEFTVTVGRLRNDVRVAVIEDAGDVVGFFPFQRHPLGVGKPVGAGLTDAQGMILARGLDLDVNDVLQACGLSVWEFDHLVADQFPGHHTSRHPSPIIDLRDGYEAYADTVKRESGKTYRTTQYKTRKIARDFGELHHHYGTRDLAGLRTLIRWKSEQYRRTGRTDRFAHPWIIQLVEDLLQRAVGRPRGGRPLPWAHRPRRAPLPQPLPPLRRQLATSSLQPLAVRAPAAQATRAT
jgi:CelD/BcsL family acetyltransferase involved in cellulose biosynthesis